MKIFQVVPYYPPHVGGMEYYVQHLSEDLATKGHDVTVFTTSNSKLNSIQKVNGVKIYSLPLMTKIYNVPVVPSLFWELLASEKPDVVHTHQYPVFFSDLAAVYSQIKQVPLIVHVHVVSDAKSKISGVISDLYYSSLGLRTLSSADVVIAPSFAYKTKLSKMHVNQKKINVIPYGIDVKKFQNAASNGFKKKYRLESNKIILSVGRLNYQKGFHHLIQAMPSILKQIPNVKLVIVGEGEMQGYLQALAKKLGVTQSVVFTGALSQTEIPAAYASCDVFALSSAFESFGISFIEAQAAGKPVIGTRTGGVPEVLKDGETGFLVTPYNQEQLESTLIRILSDGLFASLMGQTGKQFVETHYDFQYVVDSIVNVYRKIKV